MGLVEIGGVVLSRAAERVEFAAENLTNATTTGYKAKRGFRTFLASDQIGQIDGASPAVSVDLSSGALHNTGNPLDLAISGQGFFAVRAPDGIYYTRCGQFVRDGEGHMVTADGMVLQSQSGDLSVGSADPKVLPDGMVTVNGVPAGRIAVTNFERQGDLKPVAGGLFAAAQASAGKPSDAEVRQGMLEASNVSTATEMISIMSGLRSAEAGQRMVQVYDDLMSRAVSVFGQV